MNVEERKAYLEPLMFYFVGKSLSFYPHGWKGVAFGKMARRLHMRSLTIEQRLESYRIFCPKIAARYERYILSQTLGSTRKASPSRGRRL